jgi:SAM-dependent methyltransferase
MKVEELISKVNQLDNGELEQKSIITYKSIAAEYYDQKHMTCRAFDFLNEEIIQVYQGRHDLLQNAKAYLEVGAGRAILLRRILPLNSNIVIGDLCAEMAKHAFPLHQNMEYKNFSAFNLPFSDNYFEGAFAFLADSYNTKKFYQEAWRVIKKDGFLFMTCPSHIWARTLRQGEKENMNYARFTTSKGEVLQIPSITWSQEEYEELLISVGFKQVYYEDFCLPSDYPLNFVPDTISIPAQQLSIEIYRFPLVTVIMALK